MTIVFIMFLKLSVSTVESLNVGFGNLNASDDVTKLICLKNSARCFCNGASSCICNGGISALTQEQLDEVLKDLQVDKDSTNSAKRKLTSAKDDRPSAQAIGYVSIIVIGVTYSLPILLDVLRLCQKKKIADA
ncbi:hypothetical protein KUTeg_024941 [Tegillarca granosa]|uniref:Uncharacterized protein n=1 Tax=Tegillarca granosa TaxID=220873 RepID=A0ABQ9E4E5_TEGGR|nr:hypothetical protein KUTeg_024941 [Tegillarca granosa]